MSRKRTIMSLPAIAGIIIALTLTTDAQDKSIRSLFQNNIVTSFGSLLLVFSSITNRF